MFRKNAGPLTNVETDPLYRYTLYDAFIYVKIYYMIISKTTYIGMLVAPSQNATNRHQDDQAYQYIHQH